MKEATFWSAPVGEQETTISFGRDEDRASIWTNDRTMITKLDSLCRKAPETYECTKIDYSEKHEILGKRYKMDKGLLSFRAGRIQLTEEQRKARADRLSSKQSG